MNGAHDLGGRMGFGPVVAEQDEPVFHDWWESRVFAITLGIGMLGAWNLDEDRSACENRSPAEYLRLSYYQIWLAGMSRLMVEKGLIDREELASGRSLRQPSQALQPLRPKAVLPSLFGPASYQREIEPGAKFKIGDRVRARNIHPATHTRLPRYARGHVGEIVRVHGAHVFPDAHSLGRGEDPQWLYSVRFSAAELWNSKSRDCVHIDLWEPYLERA